MSKKHLQLVVLDEADNIMESVLKNAPTGDLIIALGNVSDRLIKGQAYPVDAYFIKEAARRLKSQR